jgi:hypothetical protein
MQASARQYQAWLSRHGVKIDIRGTANRLIALDHAEALKT